MEKVPSEINAVCSITVRPINHQDGKSSPTIKIEDLVEWKRLTIVVSHLHADELKKTP